MKRESLLTIVESKLRVSAEYLAEYGWNKSAKITSDTADEVREERDNLDARDKLRAECVRDTAAIVKTKLEAMAVTVKVGGESKEKLDRIMETIKWIEEDFELKETMKKADAADRQGSAVEDAVEQTAKNAYMACIVDNCVLFDFPDVGIRVSIDSDKTGFESSYMLRKMLGVGEYTNKWDSYNIEDVRKLLVAVKPYLRSKKQNVLMVLERIRIIQGKK